MVEEDFDSFAVGDWEDWIERLFLKKPVGTTFGAVRGEAYHLLLHRVYVSLGSLRSKDNFAKACFNLLETTPLLVDFAERLFTLLHLTALLRSRGSKAYLTRVILDEVLLGIEFGAQDLHLLALSVRGEFDVDEDFADYLRSSLLRFGDFRYALLVFYLISPRGAKDATDVLERLLLITGSKIERDQLSHVLRDVLDRIGCAAFYRWQHILRDSGKIEQVRLFHEVLRHAIEWEELARQGEFGLLLAVEAWSGHRKATPEEVLRVAEAGALLGDDYARKTLALVLDYQGEDGENLGWWLGGSADLDATRVFRDEVPAVVLRMGDKQKAVDTSLPHALLLQRIWTESEHRRERTWN